MSRAFGVLASGLLLLGVAAIWRGDAAAQGMAGAKATGGAATYQRMCVSCHGTDGKGIAAKAEALKIEPSLLDLTRPEAMKMTRDELKNIVLKGKNKMPGYEKKLKPNEVDPLIDHLVDLRNKAKSK